MAFILSISARWPRVISSHSVINSGSLSAAFLHMRIAPEWCGIIEAMNCRSRLTVWLSVVGRGHSTGTLLGWHFHGGLIATKRVTLSGCSLGARIKRAAAHWSRRFTRRAPACRPGLQDRPSLTEHGKLFQTAVDLRVAGDYADAVIGGTMQLRTGLLGLSLLPQELNARNSPA